MTDIRNRGRMTKHETAVVYVKELWVTNNDWFIFFMSQMDIKYRTVPIKLKIKVKIYRSLRDKLSNLLGPQGPYLFVVDWHQFKSLWKLWRPSLTHALSYCRFHPSVNINHYKQWLTLEGDPLNTVTNFIVQLQTRPTPHNPLCY